MSKISLKPSTSGTADYTITSPAGSTDRTFTLPDEAGTVLTTATDLEPQVKDSLNATGSAPVYACRAWVFFENFAGTPVIANSGNISSITDNGLGSFTFNFTTPMPDTDYATSGYGTGGGAFYQIMGSIQGQGTINRTNNFQTVFGYVSTLAGGLILQDPQSASVCVFR